MSDESVESWSRPKPWQERLALYVIDVKRCVAEDCPRCDAPTSQIATACQHHKGEIDDKPICHWTEEWQRQAAEAERVQHRERRLYNAGFTDRQRLSSGDLLVPTIAKAWHPPAPPNQSAGFRSMWGAVREFEQDRDQMFLTLTGGTGVGKTVAGAWLVAAFGGRIIRPEDIRPNDAWDEKLERALSTSFLLMDDAGQEPLGNSGWFPGQVEAIICGRYNRGLRTVICTNRPVVGQGIDSLESRYGDRVKSRIGDAANGCIIVGCGRADLRKAA